MAAESINMTPPDQKGNAKADRTPRDANQTPDQIAGDQLDRIKAESAPKKQKRAMPERKAAHR